MLPPAPPRATDADLVRLEARRELWRRGNIRHKLHPHQREVHQIMAAAFSRGAGRFVFECARRWGKTFMLCLLAIETGVRKPGCRILYGCQTLKDLTDFIIPHIETITEDAPQGLRWKFHGQSSQWRCENGSYIQLFACEDKHKANRGRGSAAELVILDECGFIRILKYVLNSVVKPQLYDSGGKILLASTPAEEPDHDFTAIATMAEAQGNYVRRDLWSNTRKTKVEIEAWIAVDAKDNGQTPEEFQRSDAFRREYLAERVVNPLLVVMGEDWAAKRKACIGRIERPEFYDAMTVLDPGGNDPYAVTFGYWHFQAQKYVQEAELLLKNGENTLDLVALVKRKEKELWGVELYNGTLRAVVEDPEGAIAKTVPEWMQDMLSRDAHPQPYCRFMDINVGLARDLYSLHQMAFLNTAKDEKAIYVNSFRVTVRREQFLLHPDCVETDKQLTETTWKDNKRREYARVNGHHGDLLDCCVYTDRNVNRDRNPVPRDWVNPLVPNALVARQMEEERQRKQSALMGTSPLARRLMRGRR